MRRWTTALVAGLLCMTLAGCGGEKKAFDPGATAQALRQAPGVFSEELEELDGAMVELLYGLEDSGVLEEVSWISPGGTAEEVTVLRFGSADQAKAFEGAARAHIAEVREANESYRPQEIPKLDKAVVERRGETLLILVSADYDAAKAALATLD